MTMPNLVLSHVASLPSPIANPSLAIDPRDGSALIVGSGVHRFRPGSPVETIFDADEDVPDQGAVTLRGDILTVYGGTESVSGSHPTSTIARYDIALRERMSSLGRLPFPLRLGVAVKHGEKDVILGGADAQGRALRSLIVSKGGRDGRLMETMLPGSAAGLQVGRIGRVAFALGSGSQDWQPPKAGYDFRLLRDEETDANVVEPIRALRDGKAQLGVCVIQKDADEFYSFGGADGNLGVSADLWHHSPAGGALIGTVVDADGVPYRVCRAVGLYSAAENAVFLIAGLVGSPFSSLSRGTDRIVRVQL